MSKFIHTLFVGVVLLGLSVPVYAQANDVDCIRCVDTRDIAPEAVNSYKIKPKAVTTDKLSKQAVTTSKLAPQAVTTGKIKDGAITENKLSAELSDSIQSAGLYLYSQGTSIGRFYAPGSGDPLSDVIFLISNTGYFFVQVGHPCWGLI
jgi:hypothetical protein